MDAGSPKRVWYRRFDLGEGVADLHIDGYRRYVTARFDHENDRDGIAFYAISGGIWIEERIFVDHFESNGNVETTYTQKDASYVGWQIYNCPYFFRYETYEEGEQPYRRLPHDLEEFRSTYEKRAAQIDAPRKLLNNAERDAAIIRMSKARMKPKDIFLRLEHRCEFITKDVIKNVRKNAKAQGKIGGIFKTPPASEKGVSGAPERSIAEGKGVSLPPLRLQTGYDEAKERIG